MRRAALALASRRARRGGRDGGAGRPRHPPRASCAKASLTLVKPGRSRSAPTTPPTRRGSAAAPKSSLEDQRPDDRQGLRVRGRLRGREAARLRARPGEVDVRAVQPARSRPGKKPFDFDINQISYHAGAREGRHLQQLVLRRQPGDRRAQGHEDRDVHIDRRACGRSSSARSSARRATRSSPTTIKPSTAAGGLPRRTPARCRR